MFRFKINKKDLIFYTILILLSIVMTMCNYTSIKNAGYLPRDTAVWTNIANGMSQGKIIYKDMFDHKGPILYFLYYFGYIIANQLGIWMLDFIFNCITVFMIYLISKQIVDEKTKILIILVTIMLFSVQISYENPCTESISVTFALIAFYYIIKYILNNKTLKKKEIIIISMCFAVVLLIKPNLAVLWILFYLYLGIRLLKEKNFKELLKNVAYSILGVAIITLLILLYLIKNNCFMEFVNTYILFNFQYTGNGEDSIINVIYFFIKRTNYIIPVIGTLYIVLIVALFIALIKGENKIYKTEIKLLIFSALFYIITLYMAIMPLRCYDHYAISMIPTVIVPLAIFLKYVESKKIQYCILIGLSCVFIVGFIRLQDKKNIFYIGMSGYQKRVQFLTDLTNKEDNILVIGNETEIYLMLDRTYKGKYFYQLPLANQNEKMTNDIINEIKKQLPKYIIDTMRVSKKDKEILNCYEKQIAKLLNENYISQDGLIYIKNEGK